MGIAFEYVAAEELVVVVWGASVSGPEWEQFTRARLSEDPNWPAAKRVLADITSVDPSALTAADTETVSAIFRESGRRLTGTKVAIVAAEGWFIATEFERRIDQLGSTTIVFNDVDGACGWLGVDLASTRQLVSALRARAR